MTIDSEPPRGREALEQFLLEELPALGPPPRGAPGLARARRFLALLDDPQNVAKPIHVVGTAGKGTTAAAIIGRLVGAGVRVGAHLSPHVYDLRERFLLDGAMPSWDRVGVGLAALWPAMLAMDDAEGRPPSFFEVTTALSWVIANAAGVSHHVTEAGIGGRFDSTNTIDRADKITVVTPIGYDHTELLGRTIEEIAANKADVITPGGQVVMGAQPHHAAAQLVRAVAADRGADLVEVGDHTHSFPAQADAMADGVMGIIGRRDGIDVAAAPAPVHLPGRAEPFDMRGTTVIVDGAHNPLKLRTLRRSLPITPQVVVAALSVEKDLEACAAEFARFGCPIVTAQFVLTAGGRVVRRSWSATELADAITKVAPRTEVVAGSDVGSAMAIARGLVDVGDTIVATGSFMMIEAARAVAPSSATA